MFRIPGRAMPIPSIKRQSKRTSLQRHRANNRRNQTHLKFEKLEPRHLLAGVFLFAATGELTIFGDSENNVARIDEIGNDTLRTDLAGLGTQDFSRSDVQTIFFVGFGGDDHYVNNTSIKSMMYGHAGDDQLQGGSGENTLVGGDGDDLLRGGGDDDFLMGGNGSDLIFGNGGNDRIVGGDGENDIDGGDGHDLIFGGNDRDIIRGGDGLDQIFALDGDDILFSGTGGVPGTVGIDQADLILGLGGNDTITGGGGLDVFYGGDGDDILIGGNGENRQHGQNGNDHLKGGELGDYLNGNNGDDRIEGLGGADGIFGSNGTDSLDGGAGNDNIHGGSGSDTASGGLGNDFIDLGIGTDDVAVYSREFAEYTFQPTSNPHSVRVSGPDGADSAFATERFRFADTEVDDNGNSFFGSAIIVRASGDMGTEQFDLQIDGKSVQTFDVTTGFNLFVFQSDIATTADQIRIVFSGDEFDEANGVDANVNVDWIDIDGARFETESPMVFSTGTWTADDGVQPGYGRGQTLHTNGYFQFAVGSTVVVRASGDMATEQLKLSIAGQSPATYSMTSSFRNYVFKAVGPVQLEQVRIIFSGDVADPDNNVNTNLNVDWIEINGIRSQTGAATVYSNATWTAADGIQPGFGRGETLNVDGFFQYSAINLNDDFFSLPEDSISVPIAVLANDRTSLESGIQIVDFTQPTSGSLVLIDQTFHYTPAPDFAGEDGFTYVALAGGFESRSITVSLNVNDSHEQPQSLLNASIAAELAPSGVFLEVEKLVKIPLGENDRQPRINSMALAGNRVFVVVEGAVDNEGLIYELETIAGTTTASLFFDVGSAVVANTGRTLDNSSPQGGFRSVAFHPEFETNGKFYTSLMEQRPTNPQQHTYLSDSATPVDVDSVLVEWTYDVATRQVEVNSYREVFRVGMPVYEHPIRGIAFNPFAQAGDEDFGLLYVGHGDGSVQSAIAGDGQDNNALGKILRVNPLQNNSASYSVPTTNPFVNDPDMIDEAYATGFRNPHTLTFAVDSAGNDHLIITEVGRDNIEEVNIVVAGGNYGWADREGPFVHAGDEVSGINVGISNLPADESFNGFTYPVSLLGHNGEIGDSFIGQAIAGGHVIQNGSSALDDQFIFVEFSTDGRAYHVDFSEMLLQTTSLDSNDPNRDDPSDLSWLSPNELTILFDHDNDDTTTPLVRDSLKDVLDDEPDFNAFFSEGKTRADLRLGQGPGGELYIMNKRNGWIYVATNTVMAAN